MATKNISLTTDAYNALSQIKRENESFSQVVLRIAKPNITHLFGTLTEKQVNYAKKKIVQRRKHSAREYRDRR